MSSFCSFLKKTKQYEGFKMTKINKSEIKIVDTATNQIVAQYFTTMQPNKSTVGNSTFGTLTPYGYDELQKKGFPVYDGRDFENLLRQTFGLSEKAINQNRGGKWDTPDTRTKFKVFINDVEFNPSFTEIGRASCRERV